MKVSNSASFDFLRKGNININPSPFTLDNEKVQRSKDPFELASEKIDSTKTKTPKLITTIDNIVSIRKKKYVFKEPNMKLPLIKTRQLLTEADLIIKKGKKLEGLSPIHIPVNIQIKKSVEINLKNKLIKNIHAKRQEIKDSEKKYINDINKRNEDYHREYKKFLNLVETEQKKQTEDDKIYNIIKLEMNEKGKILMNELAKNKILNAEIKKIINEILIFKKYGQFIHKFFGNNFIFNSLKEFDGKNYIKMAEEIIKVNENNKEDNKFYEMLASQGLYFFFMKWSNMEAQIRSELNKSNEIIEELKGININKSNNLIYLKEKIETTNKDKNEYDKEKKAESIMLNEFKDYYNNINEAKNYIKYIYELNNVLSEKKNKDLKFNNNINKIDEEDFLNICQDTIKYLDKKEKIVNKYLNEIDDIFNSEKNEDIQLIEKIMNDRKKLNIRVKQQELNKMQEIIKRKNAFKSLNSLKIIFKGRKVPQKYPLFKKKNNNKKINENENLISDYYDFICYSEEED